MIPVGKLDEFADQVGEQHRLYHLQLTAILARVLDQANPTTPMARSELDNQLFDAERFFLERFWPMTDAHLELISVASVRGYELAEPQAAELDELLREERNAISHQMIQVSFRDADSIKRSWRRLALGVGLMTAQGKSLAGALFAARHGVIRGQTFRLTDSLNRTYSSDALVRTLYRGWLVRMRVETHLYALAAAGVQLVKVTNPKPEHKHNGLVFSIAGDVPGKPGYMEIRDEVFHPNSASSVVAL